MESSEEPDANAGSVRLTLRASPVDRALDDRLPPMRVAEPPRPGPGIGLLASFYGAIGEEIQLRLFLVTLLARLLAIADALLAREVLDADQVRRLSYGQPIDDVAAPESPAPPAAGDGARDRSREKERTPLVAPLPKPLTQE